MKYLSNDSLNRPSPPEPQLPKPKVNSLLIVGIVIGAAFLAYEVTALIS